MSNEQYPFGPYFFLDMIVHCIWGVGICLGIWVFYSCGYWRIWVHGYLGISDARWYLNFIDLERVHRTWRREGLPCFLLPVWDGWLHFLALPHPPSGRIHLPASTSTDFASQLLPATAARVIVHVLLNVSGAVINASDADLLDSVTACLRELEAKQWIVLCCLLGARSPSAAALVGLCGLHHVTHAELLEWLEAPDPQQVPFTWCSSGCLYSGGALWPHRNQIPLAPKGLSQPTGFFLLWACAPPLRIAPQLPVVLQWLLANHQPLAPISPQLLAVTTNILSPTAVDEPPTAVP